MPGRYDVGISDRDENLPRADRPRTAGRPEVAAPIGFELATTPGHLVRRAQQVHTALWSQHVSVPVTGPQYSVLVALATEPDADQTRLGALASLDKNTTADVVRRLVAQGWAARSPDPADRRRRRVRLTASARAAMHELTPAASLVQQDLLAPVPAAERAAFVDDLADIAFAGGDRPATRSTAGVPLLDMAGTPGYLVRRVQQVHTSLWSELVGETLTGPQFAVLVAVAADPGLDQVTVSRLASLDRSTTADVLGRLVRDGWVVRARDGQDARRQLLALGPDAHAGLRRIIPAVQQVQDCLLGALSPRRADTFVTHLAQVAYRD